MNRSGCTNCDGDPEGSWCVSANPGCATDQEDGWHYCVEEGDTCDSYDDWVTGESDTSTNGERIVVGEPNYFVADDFSHCQELCDDHVGDVTCNGIAFVTSNNRCFLFSSTTALEETELENLISSYRPCTPGNQQTALQIICFQYQSYH